MFELDGVELTLEDLQAYARENNIDFDTYMANMKNAGMVEKTEDSTIETPGVESSAMESNLDDGSSGSPATLGVNISGADTEFDTFADQPDQLEYKPILKDGK